MVSQSFCKSFAALLSAFCLILFILVQNTPASGVEDDLYGSIQLTCSSGKVILTGMEWSIYRVASRNPEKSVNTYRTEGQFEGTPVMLNNLDNWGMINAAVTLENEAVLKKYKPEQTLTSDKNGIIHFERLLPGLYLASGKRLTIGDTTYIPTAMLIEIPENAEEDDLKIEALPKLRLRTLAGEDSLFTVRKIWQKDKGYESDRSTSIKVNIYKNGELYDVATLNAQNNWEKTWYSDADAEWRVEEVEIPKKYTVIYRSSEVQYVIENSYNPDYNSSSSEEDEGKETSPPATDIETTPTTDMTGITDEQFSTTTTDSDVAMDSDTTSDDTSTTTTTTATTDESGSGSGSSNGSGGGGGSGGGSGGGGSSGGGSGSGGASGGSSGKGGGSGNSGKLPQTGQLWWPVPFLGLGGIVLIMVGWRLRREEQQ